MWLPVATALVGSMPTDAVQLTLYIGSMLATSLLVLLANPFLDRLLAARWGDREGPSRS